jgi:type VI secretion system protein VasD
VGGVKRPLALAYLASALVACAGATPQPELPKPCPPQTMTISILTSPAVNPTPAGQPRPVVVRIYQLKNDARLYNARFEQIWHDDKNLLGEDLFKVDEVEVYPGTRTDMRFDRPKGVDHLAAVALFQDPKGRSWFSSVDLAPLPEAGKCDQAACADDDDEDCANRAEKEAHYAFWLDHSKVDDGVEHLEDFPKQGPMKKRGS